MNYQQQPDFKVFLIVGTLLLLLLCGAVIFFVLLYQRKMLQNKLDIQNLQTNHQRKLLITTINSQEKERTRVGQELHDSVGAMLSAIRLNMKMITSDFSLFEKNSDEITAYLDQTIETVRNISHNLYPAGLKTFGMIGVLKEYIEKVNNSDEIRISLIENGETRRLDPNTELIIFRILQELINNAVKHSRASTIVIEMMWGFKFLSIEVQDDGIGFSSDQIDPTKRGLGLYNISNRAEVIDAKVLFKNSESGGACINLQVPFQTTDNKDEEENQSGSNR
ncbi:MAG: ATP-binding protein [Bacteroidota bacterium]